MNYQTLRCTRPVALSVLVGLSLALIESRSYAVDLSNMPLTTSTATAMRPNVMFVLDDSGSMASRFMPDYVDDSTSGSLVGGCKKDATLTWGNRCIPGDPPYYTAGFNSMYYNPGFKYTPPVKADGTNWPDQFRISSGVPKWDQVQRDPYLNPTTVDNIETQFEEPLWCIKKNPSTTEKSDPKVCRINGTAYASMAKPSGGTYAAIAAGYNYPDGVFKEPNDNSGNPLIKQGAPFYYTVASFQWCSAWTGGTCQARREPTTFKYPRYNTSPSNFTRVNITPTACTPTCPSGRAYTDEMTNFANWYAYYRDRLSMMKTGVGRAFAGLDDSYRVGFMTIHTTPSDTSRYVQIKTNDAAQKTAWYNKLYSISTTGSTPLREALSTAGKMYAGKALVDPVQYSCQKNFTILSTDGMWNGGVGFPIGSGAIGNQDNNLGTAPRPKYDGNLLSTTIAGASDGSGGTIAGGSETLADIAMYYYRTDLRNSSLSNCTGALGAGTDVCKDNVAPTKKDPASNQHMTLFTIGLGVDGLLEFRPDYETAPTGDFAQIKTGAKNWPSPKDNFETSIDDLWHAAVNAGGTYYSAKNPQALSDGLGDALREVGTRSGSAAAASTSNPQVTTTDNYVFSANYRTAFWDSVIRRRRVSTTTGDLSKTVDWEAGAILNTMVGSTSDVRQIWMYSSGTPTKLKPFAFASLNAAELGYLDVNTWADPSTRLSQWGGLSAAGQTLAKAPGALVNYLRGQSGLEDDVGNPDIPFRGRENVLGDIVNAETIYLKKSIFSYADPGHASFVAWTETNRPVGVLFAAANDGMLHAINAETGREVWAYLPSQVLPTINELADKNYTHEFYVDGTPEIGDVFDGSAWRTILVGGFNKGGKGYYALDVTDPMNPKALWQFCDNAALCSQSDPNIGYSYGNPVITKIGAQWVVMFTSGHNNADSKGHLYGVDAITGVKKFDIVTSCTGANCGLSKITPWIENFDDNTAARVYGGDLDGNLWRFDVADTLGPAGREAAKLAQVGAPSLGLTQSITTKPALSKVGTDAVVFVGTGRFLGVSDKTDSTLNSFYAIKDDLVSPLGLVRTTGSLVKQTLTFSTSALGQSVVTNSNNTVDWTSKNGWYLDFLNSGERVFTDPSLALGTLTFTTNIPTVADPCSGGGISWLYELSWKTGGSVLTAEKAANGKLVSAKILANEFATRPVLIQLPDGKIVSVTQLNKGDVMCADGVTICSDSTAVNTSTQQDIVRGRRAGWREIIK